MTQRLPILRLTVGVVLLRCWLSIPTIVRLVRRKPAHRSHCGRPGGDTWRVRFFQHRLSDDDGSHRSSHHRRSFHLRTGTVCWVTAFFGFSRNHYDRMAHVSVGFYACPLAELLLRQ